MITLVEHSCKESKEKQNEIISNDVLKMGNTVLELENPGVGYQLYADEHSGHDGRIKAAGAVGSWGGAVDFGKAGEYQ